jgi:hypothetical protein
MHDERDIDTMNQLLLSYIGLLAERHAYGAGEGFEYQLWDDLQANLPQPRLLSAEEAEELMYLAVYAHSWVTYDVQTATLQVIDLDPWRELVAKRGH